MNEARKIEETTKVCIVSTIVKWCIVCCAVPLVIIAVFLIHLASHIDVGLSHLGRLMDGKANDEGRTK
jgi:hypothetical protein